MGRHLHPSEGADRHRVLPDFRLNRPLCTSGSENLCRPACFPMPIVIIVCCLVFCLGFSEFPETLSLSDDISNDFVVGGDATSEVDPEDSERLAVATQPELRRLFPWDNVVPVIEPWPMAASLLSLISLLRI